MWTPNKSSALTNGCDNIFKELCFWLQWETRFHFTLEFITFRAHFQRSSRPSPNATFSSIFATTQKHMENVTFCAHLEERPQLLPNVTFSTVSTTFSLFHRNLSVHSLYQTLRFLCFDNIFIFSSKAKCCFSPSRLMSAETTPSRPPHRRISCPFGLAEFE